VNAVSFVRLPRAQRRLLVETTMQLTRASLELRLGPSRRAVTLLGAASDGAAPDDPVDTDAQRDANRVGRTITRVARKAPWHPTCLRQALAARRMLHRRGIPCRVHLGVTDAKQLSAHAWVTVGGYIVVGANGSDDATPLAAFA
jgi:hypothetical protein